jgi:hypothetical protein
MTLRGLLFLVFSFIIFISLGQVKTDQQKELEALEAELNSLKQQKTEREEEARIREENWVRRMKLVDKLDSLNSQYIKAIQVADYNKIDLLIESIKPILIESKEYDCHYTSTQAVVNICDYYTLQGEYDKFQEAMSWLPDDCDGLVKEYIELTYYNSSGKITEAGELVKSFEVVLPDICSYRGISYSQKTTCYNQATEIVSPTIVYGFYLNLSLYEKQTGNLEEAIKYAQVAIYFAELLGAKDNVFVSSLTLAALHFSMGNLDMVYELILPFEESVESYLPIYQKEYYRLIAAIAANKGDVQEQENAERKMTDIDTRGNKVLSIEDQINEAFMSFKTQDMIKVFGSGEYDLGESSLERLIREMEERGEVNSIYYAKALVMMAISHKNSYSLYAPDPETYILDKAAGVSDSRVLALLYYFLGEAKYNDLDEKAFEYLEKSLELYKDQNDKISSFKIRQMLAFLNDMHENSEKAAKYYKQSINEALVLIKDYYPFLSEREQYSFNLQWISPLEKSVFAFYSRLSEKDKKGFHEGLLNFRLATKGLLLQSSAKTKLAIQNSGDENLKNEYDRLVSLKQELSMQQEEMDWKEKQSLVREIEEKEDRIQSKLGVKSDAGGNSGIDIETIQGNLSDGEFAMEVVRNQIATGEFLTDTVDYHFFIIPARGEVSVFSLKDCADMENKFFQFYRKAIQFKVQDSKSYQNYWAFLDDRFNGAQRIYMSLDGVYNGINLGALYDSKQKGYLYERYDIIQLSSLRDLTLRGQKQELIGNKSLFVGRPDYYLNDTTSISTDRGANITDLPGTEIEVLTITDELKKQEVNFESYLGKDVTENLLKSVTSPSILHIATHGYFEDDGNPDDLFESPMLSSGLLLSGAGVRNDGFGQDGILTSYEITSLDLSKTSLVVLSACESALGEGRDGQGVYGLSRAFFVAGTDAVISSLWKVDDTATQKFMILFYDSWLNGADISKSMSYAREELRKEYKDPYYWAAFIATGGIN